MSLICIIAGLLLERLFEKLQELRNFNWFEKYSQWMINHMPGLVEQGRSSIVILLLPVMLFAGLLQSILADAFFNVFSLAYAFVIFVYCLGPGDLDKEIDCYLKARENADEEMAHKC
ncbi:MAG: regulatory signaling modulator protein AmpE, partial [Gammaproteobacteria bacterium]|nr:regulatory signaling modulator protein AmpE [Gammaproteobacteria bacterium]